MTSKKSLMGFAALLIVFFHFWMPLSTSTIETTIYKSTYIGVDIFFFVSAYSQAQRKQSNYGKFILNRMEYIYAPFVVMAIINAIYKHWKIKQLLLVLCGADFFRRGGGAFLWFIVAIMLLYLIAPFIVRLKERLGLKALLIVLAIWAILVGVLQYGFGYKTIFIMLNRIPIFMLGMYYDEIRQVIPKKARLITIIAGLIIGGLLIAKYGAMVRLMKPVADFYYVVAVPFTVAVVGLFDFISQRTSIKNIPLIFIGGITLELYGMQMIFGYDIEIKIFKLLMPTVLPLWVSKLGSCILTVCILILIAWVFANIKKFIIEFIKKINNK